MSLSDAETPGAAHDAIGGPTGRKLALLVRLEWIVAILLSGIVLFVLVMRTVSAGPLWRDECDSLQHARMPHFADVLHNRLYTSFPILFPIIVRAYTGFFGTGDMTVRFLGLAIGISFLAVFWYQARSVERGVPLLMLALIGLNANFFTTGLWLRGYGVGSVLVLVAFVLTARLLLQPSLTTLGAVFLAYLASMHCLFFNGALVPCIVLAAASVLFLRREWKWIYLLLGAAAICGISYLPYVWQVYSEITGWATVLQGAVPFFLVVRRFLGACGGSTIVVSLIWICVVSACVIAGVRRLRALPAAVPSRERDLLIFALITIPLSALAYYGFVRLLRNVPLQRHFLALTCVLAASVSLIASTFSSNYPLRLGRLVLTVIMMTSMAFAPWDKLRERQSNVDLIARHVETNAGANDLIVVNPVSIGISFNHYYHGPSRWLTVPEMDDHLVHRYDLLMERMKEFFPLDHLEQEIATTLKAGDRVWIVGKISITNSDRPPLVLAPAPDPEFGWNGSAYVNSWSQQLGAYLRSHARRIDLVIHKGKLVNDRENMWLIECDGWRY